jgi:hypothetical protein
MYIGLHVKYPIFLSYCNESLIFSKTFTQKYSNIKFNENLLVGAVLFHTDRRTYGKTGMTMLIADFCNFANGPKINAINLGKL